VVGYFPLDHAALFEFFNVEIGGDIIEMRVSHESSSKNMEVLFVEVLVYKRKSHRKPLFYDEMKDSYTAGPNEGLQLFPSGNGPCLLSSRTEGENKGDSVHFDL
jgi:hypothetical protein